MLRLNFNAFDAIFQGWLSLVLVMEAGLLGHRIDVLDVKFSEPKEKEIKVKLSLTGS